MGLIPREAQNNINSAIKLLRSIDISLGRIAQALEDQNELLKVDAVIIKEDGNDDK